MRLLLGLIGDGIQQSLTPALHESEAAAQDIRCHYQLIDLERLGLGAGALPDLLCSAERTGFDGLNITHPCKQAVLPLLTDISPDALELGAVNTVVLRNGKRHGHNTDWVAFHRALGEGLPGVALHRIVQLGAGGAGSATAYAALKRGAGEIRIVDVDTAKSRALAARLIRIFGEGKASEFQDVREALRDADGLIHATPIGMNRRPGLALAPELLRPALWVADVVYFPLETELLRVARKIGCRTLDGGGMAVAQAVEAFRLFTGIEPDTARMRRHFQRLSLARPASDHPQPDAPP